MRSAFPERQIDFGEPKFSNGLQRVSERPLTEAKSRASDVHGVPPGQTDENRRDPPRAYPKGRVYSVNGIGVQDQFCSRCEVRASVV